MPLNKLSESFYKVRCYLYLDVEGVGCVENLFPISRFPCLDPCIECKLTMSGIDFGKKDTCRICIAYSPANNF